MPSTIALPSSPVPINATFAIESLPLQSILVRHFSHILAVVAVVLVTLAAVGASVGWSSALYVVSAQAPRVLRWAGDPEGGAPFVEADPSRPDRLVGFDVEDAGRLASRLGRPPRFLHIRPAPIRPTNSRADAHIGLSRSRDTPRR